VPCPGGRLDPAISIINMEVLDMLVLSRKESERIKLGDSIVVTVVRVSGDKVRLGIEAPSNILVLRDELEPFDLPDGIPKAA